MQDYVNANPGMSHATAYHLLMRKRHELFTDRAGFSAADLRGGDFRGANLSNADIAYANLGNANSGQAAASTSVWNKAAQPSGRSSTLKWKCLPLRNRLLSPQPSVGLVLTLPTAALHLAVGLKDC